MLKAGQSDRCHELRSLKRERLGTVDRLCMIQQPLKIDKPPPLPALWDYLSKNSSKNAPTTSHLLFQGLRFSANAYWLWYRFKSTKEDDSYLDLQVRSMPVSPVTRT